MAADWSTLKEAVASVIKTNGNQEITGQLLQNVLNNVISSLGKNATFAGIATPATNPGLPDGPVFYIAYTAGSYSNFSALNIPNGVIGIFTNSSDGAWRVSTLKINDTVFSDEKFTSIVDNLAVALKASYYTINGRYYYPNRGWVSYPASNTYFVKIPKRKCKIYGLWNIKDIAGISVFDADNKYLGSILIPEYKAQIDIEFDPAQYEILQNKDAAYITIHSQSSTFRIITDEYLVYDYDAISRIDDANSRIDDANSRIDDANSRIDDANSRIDDAISRIDDANSRIDLIDYSGINLISELNTYSPSMAFLKDGAETSTQYKRENITDESLIFLKKLDNHCTRFTITSSTGSSKYIFEKPGYSNAFRENIPDTVCFSFWIKEKYLTILSEVIINPIILQLATADANIAQASVNLSGMKLVTGEVKKYSFTDTSITLRIGPKINEWVQIIVDAEISDNYKSENSGKKYMYGFNIRSAALAAIENHSIELANMQIIENDTTIIGPYVIPDVNNSIDADAKNLSKSIDDANSRIDTIENEIKNPAENVFSYNANVDANSYIESKFGDGKLKLSFIAIRSDNGANTCLNFTGLEKNGISAQIITDDICPANINTSYMGANHACSDFRRCTVTGGHGLMYSDIGSEWIYNGGKYYITAIIDSTTFDCLGENKLVYPLWAFKKIEAGNIITNGDRSLEIATSTLIQGYPATSIPVHKIYIDGSEITDSGIYKFNNLKIVETYDVYNPASVLEKIRAKAWVANPKYNELGADINLTFNTVYDFKSSAQWFITTNLIIRQKTNLNFFGLTQQNALTGNCSLYIPKVLPVEINGIERDYRIIQAYNSMPSGFTITPDYYENPELPPDRYVQWGDYASLSCGYMFDYGLGGHNRKDSVTSNCMRLESTRKMYPYVYRKTTIPIEANTCYSATAFRMYKPIGIEQDGVISSSIFEYNDKLYIYLDFNKVGLFTFGIPSNFIGKQIEVFEKSNNVTLLTDIASDQIKAFVTENVPQYGYLVACIK